MLSLIVIILCFYNLSTGVTGLLFLIAYYIFNIQNRDDCFRQLNAKEGFISTSNQPGLGIVVIEAQFHRYVAYRN